MTIPLRPAYSIHRRRICVDIALVLYLSHALRKAFGKGSSPGRRFGRFREGGSTRYVGYASFFLTTTFHQTYNIYESESVVTLRTVVGRVYVGSGFCFKKIHPMRHRRNCCPLASVQHRPKMYLLFIPNYRSAKRQAPAGTALLRGLDVCRSSILLPIAAEEFFETRRGVLQ